VPVPLVLLVGGVEDARKAAEGLGGGWTLQRGWALAPAPWSVADLRIVAWGEVTGEEDARRALLAATRGAGVVAAFGQQGRLREQLFEGLRRLGPVDLRDAGRGSLTVEDEQLLALLRAGHSQAQVAVALNYSSRTVKRRLAQIRRALGVETTVEALLATAPSRAR
jgi:DNA-binding CsgD family transcriptional regulator